MATIQATPAGRLEALRDWIVGQQPRRVAAFLFGAIAVFCALGALDRAGVVPGSVFDLDGEGKPPALYSALLLFSGGALSALAGMHAAEAGHSKRWLALGAFLVFMAVDEAITFHEILQDRLATDWQMLYLPVAAAGGVAWLLVLQRLWPQSRERLLFILGAVAWFVAQLDERIQSNPEDGRVEGYGTLATIEETLELVGTALWVAALHLVLRRLWQARRSAAA